MSNSTNNNNNNNNNNGRPTRSIRGPQSALTDFLASQNISAVQIRASAEARRAAANAQRAADARNGTNGGNTDENDQDNNEAEASTAQGRARDARRKKQQQEAIARIKKSKTYKKRKRNPDESDDDLAMALFDEKAAPMPGQMANCEICDKRFTVTPYSRAGPNGGLLCGPCGKDLAKDDDANKKKQKKRNPPSRGQVGRRAVQSRLLDGISQTGAKPLMTLCIEIMAKNIHLADDLGALPATAVDRIARLLSKRRLVTSTTLNLFLQPDSEVIKVYDAARLGSNDFIRIFQTVGKLKKLKLRNSIQFKDHVMEYLISRHINLESLSLHGANLVTEKCWEDFLKAKGEYLKTLQVYYTDKHFSDQTIRTLAILCPSLTRLKICHNQSITDEGLESIAAINTLQHLSLQFPHRTSTNSYLDILKSIGPGLRTFSLQDVEYVDDRLLDAIHENCKSIGKLRITGSQIMTDAGFTRLFKGWKNKPLQFIDFSKNRHIDSARPRENEHMVGLCSEGFKAIMYHSGSQLRYLNVQSCRHISREAFEEVFATGKVYPEMVNLEVSFCEEVTDFICGSIFRCCPNLNELKVYGCMKVKDVRVPRGKILVGVPNAIGMRIDGNDG
ncbi:hypothetical protein F5Y15DRAFT_88811 [Xylariaceae sp. FL0016]|nr:hypothetical protein F5Y15DRAFT_88811 [Xylariaceae sp. FL0016]